MRRTASLARLCLTGSLVAVIAAAVMYTQVISPQWDVKREESVAATRACVAKRANLREDVRQSAALTRSGVTAIAMTWRRSQAAALKAAALFTDSSAAATRAESSLASSIRWSGVPSGSDPRTVIRKRIFRRGPVVLMYFRRPSASTRRAFGRCLSVVSDKRFASLLFLGEKSVARPFASS